MIDSWQFRHMIVAPTLMEIEMYSPAAESLLVGTALMESGIEELMQRGGGPARGLYQMEPATFGDITVRYFSKRPDLRIRCERLLAPAPSRWGQVVTNLSWATAIARLKYWMAPEKLPPVADIDALGDYWKRHYNTAEGAGDPAEFARRYRKFAI